MNANDIEQIILDHSPEKAAELIWEILQETAFQLDEAEAHASYLLARKNTLSDKAANAWEKYWGIKTANEQRRRAALM